MSPADVSSTNCAAVAPVPAPESHVDGALRQRCLVDVVEREFSAGVEPQLDAARQLDRRATVASRSQHVTDSRPCHSSVVAIGHRRSWLHVADHARQRSHGSGLWQVERASQPRADCRYCKACRHGPGRKTPPLCPRRSCDAIFADRRTNLGGRRSRGLLAWADGGDQARQRGFVMFVDLSIFVMFPPSGLEQLRSTSAADAPNTASSPSRNATLARAQQRLRSCVADSPVGRRSPRRTVLDISSISAPRRSGRRRSSTACTSRFSSGAVAAAQRIIPGGRLDPFEGGVHFLAVLDEDHLVRICLCSERMWARYLGGGTAEPRPEHRRLAAGATELAHGLDQRGLHDVLGVVLVAVQARQGEAEDARNRW